MAEHIAIYARISRDREGRAEGVALQEKRCRAYAEERWPGEPQAVYCDNDLSAARDDVVRPEFLDLISAIERREVTQLVVAELSRLTRQPMEFELLCRALQGAGIRDIHTYRTGVVPAERGSLLSGRLQTIINAHDAEILRIRTIDKHAELAVQGRPSGGRPFGYRIGRNELNQATLEVEPVQAEAARWAAEEVLRGRALTAIARDLQDRGVPTARKGRWTSTTVRSMLTAPSIAGLRTHHGVLRPAAWEPILDQATWEAVKGVLSGPTTIIRSDGRPQEVTRRHTPERRYLLTGGIARCGLCGAGLTAFVRRGRHRRRRPAYNCPPQTRGGCSGIGIGADPMEAMVADELLKRLDSPMFREMLVAGDPHEESRAALHGDLEMLAVRRQELAEALADGRVSMADWEAASAALGSREETVRTALGALPPPVFDIDPDAVRSAWELMTMNERREVVTLFVARVTVSPAKKGTRQWDPSRVEITWN